MAMEENATQVKSMLEAILKRMDEQAATNEKRHGDQIDFNNRISTELASMKKQLTVTQNEVDDTRKALSATPASAASAFAGSDLRSTGLTNPQRVEIPVDNPTARLTNEGAPLMPEPPAAQMLPQPHRVHLQQHQNHRREERGDEVGYVKTPKHDFPKFDGALPNLWLDRCITYFELYRVQPNNWFTTASLYMDGHATLWLQAFRQTRRVVTWEAFCLALIEEFGPDEFEGQMNKLLQLRQTGSVAEYRQQFETYMYHLMALDPSLNSKFFVTQFLLGLKDELRAAVRIQAPTSITRATVFAKIQEEELELLRTKHRILPQGRPPPLPAPAAARPPAVPRAAGDEFGRERQLRDFRRANGLCFKCGDRYSREHQCKKQGAQLLTIQVGEYGELLTDDAVRALELIEEPAQEVAECCLLSTHAKRGTESSACIRLRARVGKQAMLLLLDSGSTHSFLDTSFAARIGAETKQIPSVPVKVANGQQLECNSIITQLHWCSQGNDFISDWRVLDLGAYDGVIGMDWLGIHSPMQCDWKKKEITFEHKGKSITLQGIATDTSTKPQQLSLQMLKAWEDCNEIWAMAILEPIHNTTTSTNTAVPDGIQVILTDFADVFADPKDLPPSRQYDHAITLEEGAKPPNSKPYRYSPHQKDEIERQVLEMLKAGTIVHSMSPFAAPVLLVKKKDGSWRFCVDYRRLNLSTIKNKFPLPIVDELLDELAGATYFSKLDLRAGYHQIRMRPEDEEKTAFKTHHGHFHFRVMPFGLTNAPATFQCLMNAIFAYYTRKFVIVFLDDILVYSATLQEHQDHLRIVLALLRKHQLYAKASKCSFAQTRIEYLGHVITKEGVATDPAKTQAMHDWPVPMSATELRVFLGFTGYYRKFIPFYGIIAKALTQLLTKNGFHWNQQAQEAFEKLKKAMLETPVLALPNFDRAFAIETDACDTGIGAVLMQEGHPITYFSKALGVRNQKLSTYEKEFLAVMMAVDRWRPYLQRGPFTIVTDHKSLCNLGDQQLDTELQRKAMAKLVGLQFKFQYRKGVENGATDALSRVGHLMSVNALSFCQSNWVQEVVNSYETDNEAQELLQQLALHSPDEKGFALQSGLIRCKGRIWIGANSAIRTKLISALHDSALGGHSGSTATYQRVKKLFAWTGLKAAVEDYVRQCQVCQQSKHEHIKIPGKLQPLPIPEAPWQDISLDFVEGLPKSEGYDSILVVVDRFTKLAHFVPLRHPFTASQVAKALWDNVIKLHGVPLSIVSDRDRIFTSSVWKEMFATTGTKLLYSTAYHPQTDGQTERVNQCLEMYLRSAIHDAPRQWRRWLSTAEFWYNSSHHTSLGCSPFKALYGREPNLGGLLQGNTDTATSEEIDWLAHTEALRTHLSRAQARTKKKADKNRTERSFQVGEQVLLKLQPYAQSSVANRPCAKLAYKFFGPFIVEEKFGMVAYKLQLPTDSRIHPVFHVSQLKPFTPNYSPVFTELPKAPDLTVVGATPTAILDRRMVKRGDTAVVQLKVRWDSLPETATTWEDDDVLKRRYPLAAIWREADTQGGDNVTTGITV